MASGAIGLVLARPTRLLAVEPFFMELIAGLEETFVERDLSILLHVVPDAEQELATYRRWAAGAVVDAVVVMNLVVDDPRPALLEGLGVPTVVVGALDAPGAGRAPVVRTDHEAPVREVVQRLAALGHRRVARVTGPAALLHTVHRTRTLHEAAEALGVTATVAEGDYTERSGADVTRRLLQGVHPPTAIVYDNDVMALGGLAAAAELGVDVPEDLSVVAWDDSTLCRLATPPLTVMAVDVHRYGCIVAAAVLELLDGRPATPRSSPPARWLERASTGPAPRA
ncbi:LacI family DNA-binding transcriptional regulator [Actinotalea solisilvae]|uniref:LacI family DNA-binding transcriptional regulator n=1 Tax=Actinotalea solisilvae TaxID=2072922 RepID=UPI0027DAC6B4|nr:substrate-binding domain-containing protein [Actinotalea solisilvae]